MPDDENLSNYAVIQYFYSSDLNQSNLTNHSAGAVTFDSKTGTICLYEGISKSQQKSYLNHLATEKINLSNVASDKIQLINVGSKIPCLAIEIGKNKVLNLQGSLIDALYNSIEDYYQAPNKLINKSED